MKYPKSGLANVCRSLIYGLDEISPNLNIDFYGPKKNFPKTKFGIINWKIWQKFVPVSIKKYDLVHVTQQLSEYFHKIGKEQKKVVTLHDLNFLYENLPENKVQKRKNLVQENIGNADAIICISDFAKKDFIANKNLFKLKENVLIETIYNGLLFPEQKEYFSEKYQFLKSKKYILNVGVLFPKKNQIVLLDFLAMTDLDLVLVSASSKQDYRVNFLEKVKALKLENRIHILENVDENDKNFLIQNCESYVHPSLAEGFGIPPVEAMYFGKPVFLSNKTSLPEIGGNLAFYFEDFSPKKMLEVYRNGIELINNKSEYYKKEFHARAMEFDFKKMSENYLKVYEKLLAKP